MTESVFTPLIHYKPLHPEKPIQLNSHRKGRPSSLHQTSHTLSSGLRGTRSAPAGLPTKQTRSGQTESLRWRMSAWVPPCTSKSLGWNMFLMMTTFSCLFLTSPFFSGLQSNCLHEQKISNKIKPRNSVTVMWLWDYRTSHYIFQAINQTNRQSYVTDSMCYAVWTRANMSNWD